MKIDNKTVEVLEDGDLYSTVRVFDETPSGVSFDLELKRLFKNRCFEIEKVLECVRYNESFDDIPENPDVAVDWFNANQDELSETIVPEPSY